MKILFILACACVIAATVGAVAIGLSLFTQPEAYTLMLPDGPVRALISIQFA